MVKITIPRHSSCLDLTNYKIYFNSLFPPFLSRTLELEQVFRTLFGRRPIFPTPTGCHALWYFLDAVQLKSGDEVLVSAYNLNIVIQLLVQRGLIPIFVDIDPDTLCLCPEDLKKKITKKTRLVIVTHMFGNPADLSNISRICDQNKVLLFEDCAHAIGSYCDSDHVGTKSDGALFSFGIFKLINSFGGGMLVYRNSRLLSHFKREVKHTVSWFESFYDNFKRCMATILMTPVMYTYISFPLKKLIKKYIPFLYCRLQPPKYRQNYYFEVNKRAPFKPYMQKMIEYQIKRLGNHINKRKEIVNIIKSNICDVEGVRVLNENKFGKTNYSYFGIYVSEPEAMLKHLQKNRIIASTKEFSDCSSLPQFSEFNIHCKNANYADKHILCLPNYPGLTEREVRRIYTSICSFNENYWGPEFKN